MIDRNKVYFDGDYFHLWHKETGVEVKFGLGCDFNHWEYMGYTEVKPEIKEEIVKESNVEKEIENIPAKTKRGRPVNRSK